MLFFRFSAARCLFLSGEREISFMLIVEFSIGRTKSWFELWRLNSADLEKSQANPRPMLPSKELWSSVTSVTILWPSRHCKSVLFRAKLGLFAAVYTEIENVLKTISYISCWYRPFSSLGPADFSQLFCIFFNHKTWKQNPSTKTLPLTYPYPNPTLP